MSNLIVTRRPGESVLIGEDVVVTILGVKGNQVRVSINAPAEVAVDREEIRVRKDQGLPPPSPPTGRHQTERTLQIHRG